MDPESRRIIDNLTRRVSGLEQDLTRIACRPAVPVNTDGERLCQLVDYLYNTMAGTATAKLCYADGTAVSPQQDVEITLSASPFFGFAFVNQFLWIQRHTNGNWRPTHNGVQMVLGKTDGSLASAGTATVSVWTKNPSGADTGVNLTVRHEGLFSGTLASAKWIYCSWKIDQWVFEGGQC